ncbi:replication initiation protein [Propionivibrio dicarboxylicus]|uniref:Initiator Replication protein n=1 Tax=Propionivibrio dicarboxylicus TaxID=83767 RepID=A0A1G8EUN8_9RHOO|nr:replication initiation protein [Propionivibrio dicarboxylicus]SDH73565.1 Initiator Replication protein [Propionivibrio dicarboxylicus]
MGKENLPVPQKKEFKKANEIIAPRVARGGSLSLLGRKVFNVLLYHTQRLGAPGDLAPEGAEVFKSLYWLPLSELAKDAAFNSDDAALLKDTLLKLQDIKIITDSTKGFSSDVLVASVKIIPGERKRPTMVGWGLHPATEEILRSPEFFTRLSLYYLTSLKTNAGAALYENCKRYATNPSHLTRREPWEWWHEVLTGTPIATEKPEYKYFKRDTLKPALAEIETTDIQVEMVEHKNGRRVTDLQFKVFLRAQGSLELPPPPVIDTALIKRIVDIGIYPKEAEDLFAKHDEQFLVKTLDLVSARARDSSLSPITSIAAFFRTAVKRRYADAKQAGTRPQTDIETKQALQIDSPASNEKREKIDAALKWFDDHAEDERQRVFSSFVSQTPFIRAHAAKSKKSPMVRQALGVWLIDSGIC